MSGLRSGERGDREVLLGVRQRAGRRDGGRAARGAQGRHRRLRRPRRVHGAGGAERPGGRPRAASRRTTSGARDELERHGGTVEKFIGDAVVAVFGAPVAHEDDPERAVRAALAIRDAVAELNDAEPGRDLHVRIGVNTGEALVSLDAAPGDGEGMVAGDVINTAARLQSAAAGRRDPRRRADVPRDRARDRVPRRRARRGEGQGASRSPSGRRSSRARGSASTSAEPAARRSSAASASSTCSRTRCAGRGATGRPQLVTLVGVPGIGKSRLVLELVRVVDADAELITWRQGRSLPYGDGVSFWALGEIVKAQAGILESDAARRGRARSCARCLEAIADEGERALGRAPSAPARRARPRRGERGRARRGVRRLAALPRGARRAAARSVLVFEDLHWADDGLLDFVDGLVDWVDRRPAARRLHRAARAARAPARAGAAGSATRARSRLAALDDEDDRAARARAARPPAARGRDPAGARRTRGRQPALRGGVRAHARRRARASTGGCPRRCRASSPPASTSLPAAEKDAAPARGRARQGVLVRCARGAVGDRAVAGGGAAPLARAEGVRSPRAPLRASPGRRSTRSSTRSSATRRTARCRGAARAERHRRGREWIESLPGDRAEDRAETARPPLPARRSTSAARVRRGRLRSSSPRAVKA